MVTMRVRLVVRDYEMWRTAFGKDAAGRQSFGATGYRIFRPQQTPTRVELDVDFSTAAEAEAFLEALRRDVWSSSEKAPAKVGAPEVSILEFVENHAY